MWHGNIVKLWPLAFYWHYNGCFYTKSVLCDCLRLHHVFREDLWQIREALINFNGAFQGVRVLLECRVLSSGLITSLLSQLFGVWLHRTGMSRWGFARAWGPLAAAPALITATRLCTSPKAHRRRPKASSKQAVPFKRKYWACFVTRL